MTKFIKADSSYKEDVIDFINYVFSYTHRPHDFKKMVPKIYADDADSLDVIHYLAMENDKIKAVISYLKIEVKVGAETLKYGFIGNVAVHPYARGRNYMKTLLRMAIEDSKNDGVDIMALGGQRQRYGYFGFEHAGAKYKFVISKANIRHCMKDVECSDISFALITSPNAAELDSVKELYERRPVHTIRPRKEFLHIMHSWENELYAIKKNGQMIGYIYGNAQELVLKDESSLPLVIKAWFEREKINSLEISVPPYEKERIAYLSGICESMSIHPVERVRVLNWEKILRVLLEFKQEYCPLQDGEAEFCIEEEAFRIQVCCGKVCVEKVCEQNKNIMNFTRNEAEMLFFGLQNMLNPKEEYKNWLPIPFFIDIPDLF